MISVFMEFFRRIVVGTIVISPFLQAYTVVNKLTEETIDFHCMSKNTATLYCSVSKNNPVENQELLFSHLRLDGTEFSAEPISKAIINFDSTEIEHPFKDCQMQTFALMSKDETLGMQSRVELPVFVTKQEPNHIYMFESISKTCSALLKSPEMIVVSEDQQKKGSVIKLETADGYIFAFVAPDDGVFGDSGSNISVLIRGFDKERDENGVEKENARQVRVFSTMSAFPIEKKSAFLAINHALDHIGTVADMYWDPVLHCLYVGFEIKTSENTNAGGYSVAVGRFKTIKTEIDGKNIATYALMLTPIVTYNALQKNAPCVIGAMKQAHNLCAQHVRTLHTTGGVPYLLVHGGNGNRNETCCSVFAFPVINSGDAILHGTIASIKAIPKDIYRPLQGTIQAIAGRVISQPATSADEMPDAYQEAVVVGGGDICEPIEEIFSQGEAVFARTHSGIFHSQALLNEYGMVKGWSCWQKIVSVGRAEELSAAWLNINDGSWTYIVKSLKGEEIRRSTWNPEIHQDDTFDMVQYTQHIFKQNKKKISYVNSISLSGRDEQPLIFVGDDTVALFNEHGIDELSDSTQARNRLQHALDSGVGSYLVEHHFKDIAPVTSVELINDVHGEGATLLIGGYNGLMVLSQESLLNKPDNCCVKKIGDYTRIKKIIYDGLSVYILTPDRLDRIDLHEKPLYEAIKSPTKLATKDGLSLGAYGCFYDCIVSGPLGLLATSHGLYQVAQGRSIVRAKSPYDCAWKRIAIPEGLDPVLKIVAATKTGREQDLTAGNGGHIYVLSAYAGKHQSFINRFSVPGCQETAELIIPFFDHYIESVLHSHFLNFSSYKQDFFTDGAVYLSVGADEGCTSKKRQLYGIPSFVEPHLGARMSGARSKPIVEVADSHGLLSKITRLGHSGRLAFIAGGELITHH